MVLLGPPPACRARGLTCCEAGNAASRYIKLSQSYVALRASKPVGIACGETLSFRFQCEIASLRDNGRHVDLSGLQSFPKVW
jgi:hypothetical protein